MIELAILGLLLDQELHGYELKKRLGELLGPWSSMSYGSLYPALARLEKSGAVKAVESATLDEPTAPMTGALSGELAAFRRRVARPAARGRRGKKVYGITDLGEQRFRDLMASGGSDDDRSFALRVAFCRHLDPVERLALFEQRRTELANQLAARRSPTDRDLYLRSLRERDTRTITADLAWLDELTAAVRAEIDGTSSNIANTPTHERQAGNRPLTGGIHS